MEASGWAYTEALSELYPTRADVAAEIAELEGRLTLPRSTELFASDIHGEYEAFSHILRNGSGSIRAQDRRRVRRHAERRRESARCHAHLLSAETMELDACGTRRRRRRMVRRSAARLASPSGRRRPHHRACASALPEDFAYLIEELMTERSTAARQAGLLRGHHRRRHPHGPRGRAPRGAVPAHPAPRHRPAAHRRRHVRPRAVAPDSSWTSSWATPTSTSSGATTTSCGWAPRSASAAASRTSCATARATATCPFWRTPTASTSCPLATFAPSAYANDPCVAFGLKGNPDLPPQELEMNVKIQKAMAIIQFKVEAQLIDENPGFGLEDRNLLRQDRLRARHGDRWTASSTS